MRINKYIGESGFCSRRKADELIDQGRVSVNGKKVFEKGTQVTENDLVTIDGREISLDEKFYLLLNKPVGYISSNYDPHNKKDLNSLVKINKRFFCAGRLDKDSHGLMLLTNDGDLVEKISHPRNKLEKTYLVKVSRKLSEREKRAFEKGLDIGRGEVTGRSYLDLLKEEDLLYQVKISQGYNRQIRRMFGVFGVKVMDLERVKIGELSLGTLEDGAYRSLNSKEMKYLESLR